jgi:hypothetical protein
MHQTFELIRRDTVELMVLSSEVSGGEFDAALRERMREYGDVEAMGLTLEQANSAGLLEVSEAVVVTVESPAFSCMLRRHYERRGNGDIVFTTPVEYSDEAVPQGHGRFSGLFCKPHNRA